MRKVVGEAVLTPDSSARGFLQETIDPQRYQTSNRLPSECFELIVRLIPSGAQVLDVGCGSGDLADLLRSRCHAHVVGVEPDPTRAAHARALGLEIFEGMLTLDACQQLGQFDVVVFADVIEHLPDPLALLHLSRRLLRPAGFIVVSVPNIAHWTVRLSLLKGQFDYAPVGIMDATHLRWFTARTLEQLLSAAGFELELRSLSVGLEWYGQWQPWWRIPVEWRRRLVLSLAKRWPQMWAYQYIVKPAPLTLVPRLRACLTRPQSNNG